MCSEENIRIVQDIWHKVDIKIIGRDAFVRLLIAYPWTQRFFTTFGNLDSADAISNNAKVQAHGEKVLASITEGLKHLDNLKGHFAKLSQYHSEKLLVDPATFNRFRDVLMITLARHFQQEFTPEIESALQSAFRAIGDAQGYH